MFLLQVRGKANLRKTIWPDRTKSATPSSERKQLQVRVENLDDFVISHQSRPQTIRRRTTDVRQVEDDRHRCACCDARTEGRYVRQFDIRRIVANDKGHAICIA